jgi:hypothetical protein
MRARNALEPKDGGRNIRPVHYGASINVALLIWARSIAVSKPVIVIAIANVMMRLRMSLPTSPTDR